MTGETTTTATPTRLTVAICTWNRCELLRQTLEQMTRLAIPAGVEWEVLVVNNNCTDRTDDVIASFAGRLPVRRLFEPEPGQSNARNRAVREASGEYILWTDDDVLVDEGWIAAYDRAFRRWPDAAFFGGPIEPWFVRPPPPWIERTMYRIAGAFAVRDLGAEAIPLGVYKEPFGANMAMRLREQARFPYDPTLGLSWARQGNELRGDETAVIHGMLEAGATGWWVPDARVRHYVPEHRQSTRYIRRFFMGYGEYCGRHAPEHHGPMLFGRPRYYWRRAVEAELRYRLHRLFRAPEVWIEDLFQASQFWGEIRGYPHRGRP